MAAITADMYPVFVHWSAEDNEYVATSSRFPSLSWLAATKQDARAGYLVMLQAVITDMYASGEALPSKSALGEWVRQVRTRRPDLVAARHSLV